jgi:hypothetical protein
MTLRSVGTRWRLLIVGAAFSGFVVGVGASCTSQPISEASSGPAGGGGPAGASDVPEMPAGATSEVSGCPEEATVQDAARKFDEAVALLENCGESCMKSATEGERYRRGMELLREASLGGHLDAQAKFGVRSFGDLMTTGDGPELEEAYVTAIASLRAAALGGDSGAAEYVPGVGTVRLVEGRKLEPELEEPLSTLPEKWVLQGIEQGDRMAACAVNPAP